ncbi:MAG: hypothetical protein JW809_11795 [Pirellulales bacterium]|nr:hypothetical protein [Pirellulales bacterium]
MPHFLLTMLADLFTGMTERRLDAAEAFGAPPVNPTARRYARAALALILAAAALFLIAALVHVLIGPGILGEAIGWSGVVCLELCVLCGLRYAAVNRA